METNNNQETPTPPLPQLIILTSEEPVWEWRLDTDQVFFSRGLLKALQLSEPPTTMKEFYALMRPDAARRLISAREGIISGQSGSVLDCGYLLKDLWAHENLMVLTRDGEGKAGIIIGRLVTSPIIRLNAVFKNAADNNPGTGLWLYDVANKKIYSDNVSDAYLGVSPDPERDGGDFPSFLTNIRPEDRETLRSHYELFCSGPSLGNHISDFARVMGDDGQYMKVVIRSSALRRDERGRATIIGGMVSVSELQNDVNAKVMKDDRLFHALNALGSGQWNWDTKNDVMYFCSRYLAIMGYNPENGKDFVKNWRDYIHPDDLAKVGKTQLAVVSGPENGETYECTYRMRRADGEWAWIFDRGFVIWREKDGRAGHLIGSMTNITTAQAGRDQLEELVRHDSLTGLRSRAYCNLELEHIEQNRIRPVSIISLDISGLKMINDSLGHARGDELLTKAASILRDSLRASDCVARMGGDEFMVVLPNCNEEKREKLLKKIRTAFDDYNAHPENPPVFAGIGGATLNDPDENISVVIAKADENMYADKRTRQKNAHAAIRAWVKYLTGKEAAKDSRVP